MPLPRLWAIGRSQAAGGPHHNTPPRYPHRPTNGPIAHADTKTEVTPGPSVSCTIPDWLSINNW